MDNNLNQDNNLFLTDKNKSSIDNIDDLIHNYTGICVFAVKKGDREKAIKYRDKVINLLELKQENFILSKEENQTLKTLKLLAKNTNNKRFANSLKSKIIKNKKFN